jgi:hypothetical protein
MEWTSVENPLSRDISSRVHELVQHLWMTVPGSSERIAVFARLDLEASSNTYYFTPPEVGASFGSTPCETPRRDGLALCIGSAGAWEWLA